MRAYLDHASSSPLRPVALDAMLPFLRDHHADPGRVHQEGHITRAAIEEAREHVAALFGARPREVVFTSSGTESVNTAVFGALGRRASDGAGHVVTTAVEHSAVLESARRGASEVTEVGVDSLGHYDAAEVLDACRDDTALVTVQLANHEVGTVQPVADVVAGARERGITVHVDACAAAGHLPVDFGALGADLVSVTGHKFGGPKGAAALLVRRGLRFPPFVVGGAQERARRGGIENVPAIVGFDAAAAQVDVSAEAAQARHSRSASPRVRVRSTASHASAIPSTHSPPRVPRGGGRGGGADPARPRPARRGRAQRFVVLERVARTVARARGDGRGGRPVAARAWAGARPTTTWTCSSPRSPKWSRRCEACGPGRA
ncbi:MAG: aminotransferase class V-fold PLP-dependent enzyme [Acidimicrobiia bacterium]